MDEAVASVARDLRDAETAIALTGAGVSTASGIPAFRGSEAAAEPGPDERVWDEFDPTDFHRRRFDADPEGFWTDRIELHDRLRIDADPNAAHEALAAMERQGDLDLIVTQNVDGLHQAAGAERVVELHGNAGRVVCDDCGATRPAEPVFERAHEGERPPTCGRCDGPLKPDVVLFGEDLPGDPLDRAQRRARECDLFLAAGSSLNVRPASLLPRIAAEAGATLVVVNLEATPVADRADHTLRRDVTELLPALARAVRDGE